ncbi:MAG: GAF domain-containing protein, partial [Bacteroidota bacterium]|nr:GAF domain-containing protein [Bacteroidota bacterium]
MARVLLRHILSPKSELTSLVQSLLLEMNADVFIEDTQGNHLLGIPGDATAKFEAPVKIQDEILGWVKGDHRAPHIATLLSVVARKEYDRKSLGSEVLLLYQEVNMVFNFSDKLAQAIDPESIAQIAVEEAMHLIGSVGGVVVLWDEIKKQLQIPATAGNEVFQKEQISSHLSLLLHIGLSGQSEIMDDLSSLKEAGIIGPEVQSVIYAALKVKHRIMGAIILAGDRPAQFAAADLKFLTTLALQSSAAIESALLYEKNIREAREKEEAMRAVYEITAKFVPYEFIGSLGREVITEVRLGDQVEKVVTVLFADLRDFTTLSEQMTPEENFQFISSFNGNMGPIIR